MKFFLAIRLIIYHDLFVGGRWKAGHLVEARTLHIAFFMGKKIRFSATFIFLIFGAACQNTQAGLTHQKTSHDTLPTKATPLAKTESGFLEIYTQVQKAPRSASDMESSMLLDPLLQSCLRASAARRDGRLKIALTGHLSGRGEVQSGRGRSADPELDTCATQALQKLKLGKGKAGEFEMTFESISTEDPRSGQVKTMRLDVKAVHEGPLNPPVKKFEKTPVTP